MSLSEKNEIIENIKINTLQEFKNTMEEIFDICADLIEHPLQLKTRTDVSLYYFESITDGSALKEHIITPLLQEITDDIQIFIFNVIATYSKTVYTWNEIKKGILEGQCLLFMEGEKKLFLKIQKDGQKDQFKNLFHKLQFLTINLGKWFGKIFLILYMFCWN